MTQVHGHSYVCLNKKCQQRGLVIIKQMLIRQCYGYRIKTPFILVCYKPRFY